jgi:hypothetical protein
MLGEPELLKEWLSTAAENGVERVMLISSMSPHNGIIGSLHRASEKVVQNSVSYVFL